MERQEVSSQERERRMGRGGSLRHEKVLLFSSEMFEACDWTIRRRRKTGWMDWCPEKSSWSSRSTSGDTNRTGEVFISSSF